jgi:hypothetical protein
MVDRWAHSMVYDRARDRLVMTGGVMYMDQWEWNGQTWAQVPPALVDGYRWNFAMAYDPRRQRTLMTGGQASDFSSYEYDGSKWLSVPSSPSFNNGCVMDYDPNRRALEWLVDPDGTGFEMWEWDGVAWTKKVPVPTLPPLYRPTGVFDPIRNELLLFGGRTAGTYQNTTRAIFYQPNVAPEACTSAAIDYDHDGLAGCADPDCASRCAPLCIDGVCPANAPKCGDGICDPLEDCLLCPDDCHTCPPDDCGDFRCSGTENATTCPGDCP